MINNKIKTHIQTYIHTHRHTYKHIHTYIYKVRQLTMQNWLIHFGWVKAHTGIEGNKLEDKLAKEAAEDDGELKVVYIRIPTTTVATELKKEGLTSGRDNGKAPTEERYADRSSRQQNRD